MKLDYIIKELEQVKDLCFYVDTLNMLKKNAFLISYHDDYLLILVDTDKYKLNNNLELFLNDEIIGNIDYFTSLYNQSLEIYTYKCLEDYED